MALAIKNPKYRQPIGAALGLGALFGVILPFSREHESEADRIGLHLMAKAGYDPEQAIGVWERMEAASGWEFVSTRPSPGTRREQIRSWLPEVKGLHKPVVAADTTQHSEKLARMVAEVVAENGEIRQRDRYYDVNDRRGERKAYGIERHGVIEFFDAKTSKRLPIEIRKDR